MKLLLPMGCLLCLTASLEAKLSVVATTPDLGAIAREVGGNLWDLNVLAKPTEDPHFVDAKPSLVLKLNRADALLEGGADLETGWLPALLSQSRNARIQTGAPGRIRCNTGVAMKEVPTSLDRSQGDLHALGNPHYAVDPGNAVIISAHLAESFARLDPANAEAYRANQRKFAAQIAEKMPIWKQRFAPFQGRHLAVYHSSWIYFGECFGLNVDLYLEPKPGLPPTPTHLAELMARMKQLQARVIMLDPYLNRRTAEKVASETGAVIVPVAQFPGAIKGTEEGYVALLDYLVNALAKALDASKTNH